jgi:hypothetical protein
MLVLKKTSKFFDILGKFLALCSVTLIAVLYINSRFAFIGADIVNILYRVREYAILATLIVVGLEWAVRRNIVFFIIYCVIALIAIGFSFPALFF